MAVSATLAINQIVETKRRAGQVIVPLGFGEAGLPVHPELRAALAEAAARNSYGPVAGIGPLRAAAAGYWDRRDLPTDPDLVVAGPGSKPLLFALLLAIGGDVALPKPSWVSYAAQAALLDRRACLVPTVPGNGGVPDPERLADAAVEARTAGRPLSSVVLTVPDNPTGTLARPDVVREICEVARRHDLVIISDEIYRDLVHDGGDGFLSPAEVAPERTVITTGLSKSLALGGWRIGVTRLPDSPLGRTLFDSVTATASEVWSSPAQPVQHAAAWAFTEPAALRARVEASRVLHARIVHAVANRFVAAGAAVVAPQAAFYCYPDFESHRKHLASRWSITTSDDLAEVLLNDLNVAVLPGSAFGDDEQALKVRVATSLLYGDDDEQRLTALGHPEPETLAWIGLALDRLSTALAELTGEARRT
jgi:aspartate aminotransferase